ncbi:MAG: ABC transporter substrate-binding protein [Bacillota bacterium]
MFRRSIALGIVLVFFVVAVSALGWAASPSGTVRWSYRLTPEDIVFTKGKFAERYGVTVQSVLFATGIEARDALIAGAIDVAELGVSPAVTALARAGRNLVIIAGDEYGGGKYRVVVPKGSPIKTVDELRGKKVAIKVGSGNYTAFLQWVQSRGYNIKDFQIVDVGDADAVAAMESRSVDAVIYWEPIPAILVAKGIAREIFDFEGYVTNPVWVVARREWVEKNPDLVARFLAGWIEALAFMTEKPAEAAEIISKALAERGIDIPATAYTQALKHDRYEPWLHPFLIRDTIEVHRFLVRENRAPANIDWKVAFDPRPLAQAMQLVVERALTEQ